jgi:hypothetical protein
VLEALVDVVTDVLEADSCSVLVWDDSRERLIPGATRGFKPETVAQMPHAPGEGITTRVASGDSSLHLEVVLRSLVDVAKEVMNANTISVTIWDPQRQQLATAASHRYRPESLARAS